MARVRKTPYLPTVAAQGTIELLLCEASTGIVLREDGGRWASRAHPRYQPVFETLMEAEAKRDELLRRHPFAEVHLSRVEPEEHLGRFVAGDEESDAYEHELLRYLRWQRRWWRRLFHPKPQLTFEHIIELDRSWGGS